jgi:DNA-directed RNA polymerase subunit RPC12/RpoP
MPYSRAGAPQREANEADIERGAMTISACPNCNGKRLFKSKGTVSAGGGHAPNYLPQLGTFLRAGRFYLVICQDCGLTRFFATREACEKLPGSTKWQRV